MPSLLSLVGWVYLQMYLLSDLQVIIISFYLLWLLAHLYWVHKFWSWFLKELLTPNVSPFCFHLFFRLHQFLRDRRRWERYWKRRLQPLEKKIKTVHFLFQIFRLIGTLFITSIVNPSSVLCDNRDTCEDNKKLKYVWGDALTDSPNCLGPKGTPYPS